MKSGSVNNNQTPKPLKANKAAQKGEAAKTEGAPVQEQPAAEVVQQPSAPLEPKETVELAMVAAVDPDLLKTVEKPDGGLKSEKGLFFGNIDDREKLEQAGAVYIEDSQYRQLKLGDALGENGTFDATPLFDTENPSTVNIAKAIEVPNELTAFDETTQQAVHNNENFVPIILNTQDNTVTSIHQDGTLNNAKLIPDGFVGVEAKSPFTVKAEKYTKWGLLGVGKFGGIVSAIGLAGLTESQWTKIAGQGLAPAAAVATAITSAKDWSNAKDREFLLDKYSAFSEGDLKRLENAEGQSYYVSESKERVRLRSEVKKAVLGMIGAGGLVGAAGATLAQPHVAVGSGLSNFLGYAPWIAGGAFLLHQGPMLVDSVQKLGSLKKERKELEALLAKGETHVERIPEVADATIRPGRVTYVAEGDRPVDTPIDVRLKEMEQEREGVYAQVMGMGSMAAIGASVLSLPAWVSYAGYVPSAGFFAYRKLDAIRDKMSENKELKKELGEGKVTHDIDVPVYELTDQAKPVLTKQLSDALLGEVVEAKKELQSLDKVLKKAEGKPVTKKTQQAFQEADRLRHFVNLASTDEGFDAIVEERFAPYEQNPALAPANLRNKTYVKQTLPISVLLDINSQEIKKQATRLAYVGGLASLVGVTFGAGGGFAIGAMMAQPALEEMMIAQFTPIGQLLKGVGQLLISPFRHFTDEVKTEKKVKKSNAKLGEDFAAKKMEQWEAYRESDPGAFNARPSNPEEGKYGGWFYEMSNMVKEYAGTGEEEDEHGNKIRHLLAEQVYNTLATVPENLKPAFATFTEDFQVLQADVEAQWGAREIALEMDEKVTTRALNDERMKARLTELEYSHENLEEQYEEGLNLFTHQGKLAEKLEKARGGDLDASREITKAKVFQAARLLSNLEESLGKDVYNRYVDAVLRRSPDEEQQHVIAEVLYFQGIENPAEQEAFAQNHGALVKEAYDTLNTPINLKPTRANEALVEVQKAAEELHAADPENVQKLYELDTQLSDGKNFEGMSAQEALASRTKLNAQFQAVKRTVRKNAPEALKAWEETRATFNDKKAEMDAVKPQQVFVDGPKSRQIHAFRSLLQSRPKLAKRMGDSYAQVQKLKHEIESVEKPSDELKSSLTKEQAAFNKFHAKLKKKEPSLIALWDKARVAVDEEHVAQAARNKVRNEVVSNPNILKFGESVGMDAEAVGKLFDAHTRSLELSDPRVLEDLLANEAGDGVDQGKVELLQQMHTLNAQLLGEATGQQPTIEDVVAQPQPEQVPPPLQDPYVDNYLKQNPGIVPALQSEQFGELAKSMELEPEQVQSYFLIWAQAQLNPVMAQRFQEAKQAGDVQTNQLDYIGTKVNELVIQLTTPPDEVVQKLVQENLDSAVYQNVLMDPNVKASAEQLGVNAEEEARFYLEAVIGNKTQALPELQARAQSGDAEATGKLNFITQVLLPYVQHESQRLAAQGGGPAGPGGQAAA